MEKDTISVIDSPGALILEDPAMRGLVVVSEVHACSAYARLLTAQEGSTIALGLNVEPPVSGVASAAGDATWVRNASSGNFRSRVNKKGDRRYYPLFRLVSLTETATSTGLRGKDETDTVPSLPDAEPPWDEADIQSFQKRTKSRN